MILIDAVYINITGGKILLDLFKLSDILLIFLVSDKIDATCLWTLNKEWKSSVELLKLYFLSSGLCRAVIANAWL